MEAGTRSEVKVFIKKGRVTVNGEIAKSPEQKVDETKDTVTLDGHSFSYQKYFYYMLHKPAGVVTAVRDHHDQTVLDLLVDAPGKDLSPVGRLDKDTEGLLLITNDGALAHRLLSPVKHVPKTYLVHTKKPVTSQMCEKLEAGVEIGDETPTAPAKTKLLSDTDCGLLLTITEGRFHQVKRMLQAVGNEVVYLKRLSMGALVLDETLSKGSWRALTEEEKAQLGV
jgi:pseudouridylate synthase